MARLTRLPQRLAALPPRVVVPPKRAEKFYQSPGWLALVARRKRDPDYRAAKERARPGERLILDHVVERRDGGAELDPANTQWLTFSEHQAKTARSRAARAALPAPRGGG